MLRFDGETGAFIGRLAIAPDHSGLHNPGAIAIGQDRNIYVQFDTLPNLQGTVRKYSRETGESSVFVPPGSGNFGDGFSMVRGPDGHLYAADWTSQDVKRFNGATGAFMGPYVSLPGGRVPNGLTFGPDGRLYVSDFQSIRVFNGVTAAPEGTFGDVTALPALIGIGSLVFGPDGHLYVVGGGSNNVAKFDGTTGASLGMFATGGDGLTRWSQAKFGPDGDLYVGGAPFGNEGRILRFDGQTGVFRGLFVAPRSGGLLGAPAFEFHRVGDPVALAATVQAGVPSSGAVAPVWTKVSGPGEVAFTTPSAASTMASFTQPGTYVLRVTVTDGTLSSSDDVTITVALANYVPVVDAGSDQSVESIATLGGQAFDDNRPTGGSLTAAWMKVSGPGGVVFEDASQPLTTATFDSAGVYVLRLTASDADLSASDDVTIIATLPPNRPPAVEAGPDQAIAFLTSAMMVGSATDDGQPAGSLSFVWSQINGPGIATFADSSSATTSVEFNQPGTYTLRLTVSDSSLSGSDDVTVTVNPTVVNQPPIVSAGANHTI